jgi:hypothetical protein
LTQLFHYRCILFCISFVSLCAHRIYKSRYLKSRPAVTFGDQVFGECNSVRLLDCTNDYFLVVHALVRLLHGGLRSCTTTSYYFTVDVRGTTLFPFFLHQLKIDYFEQLNISTVGNGTVSASSTGPASGYDLELSHLFIVFFLFLYRLSVNTNNPYEAIILLNNNIMICLVTFNWN